MTRQHTVVPVVLSGGMGTRLWPASRRLQPKQLLPLVDDRSMIQATIDRVHGVMTKGVDPIIVTNVDHADAIQRELIRAGYRETRLILEPVGRNTAPAVAVAALEVVARGADDLMLVLPADHTITDESAFADALDAAAEVAAVGYLVTFGITPSAPETGYGYLRSGEAITDSASRLAEFKEKPDLETATSYLASGDYLWNSGMFMFKASRYLEELEKHAPDISASSREAFESATRDGLKISLGEDAFAGCRAESIDYAVMEHTSRAAVVPTDPGWNDVGSWSSLWEIADHSPAGNVISGDVTTVNVTNSYVRGSNRLVAAVGVDNTIIVDTPDALLVASMDAAQDVNAIVEQLKEASRPEYETDGTVHRPWGSFRTIDKGPGYRVLHLWLDPGGKTSMKRHEHRSEHWLVVRGVARITTDEATRLVPTRESVYIPPGEVHRLENPGDEVLEVIEVDVGSYVGEDDIKRFMDAYGRAERQG
ncbi:MAG: mannose-1-phosphate guanylyltransferase/mannose-6-phosphate isomerase [Proteobacteria bacterium]|nr:mannose-1-phosphate guanylyltransferase/mannose-6-phosphate isomerase [Pseudomonadota bacterium]